MQDTSKDHPASSTPSIRHQTGSPQNRTDHDDENPSARIYSRLPAGVPVTTLPGTPAPGMNAPETSRAVGRITGETAASYKERRRDLSALREEQLSSHDLSRLLDYLADTGRLKGMSDSAFHVFINDLVALFHDRESLDDRYLAVSRDLIRNQSEDEVIRDYTLQGLSRGYENASLEQAEMIRSIFWQTLAEVSTSLGGTAIHALERIRSSGKLPPEETLSFKAALESVLGTQGIDERVRIPAIQAATAMDLLHLSPALEQILNSPSASSPEKVAALGALAKIDPPRAHYFYRTAARSEDPLLAHAAGIQLKKEQNNR